MQCRYLLPVHGLSLHFVSPARPQIVTWVWEWVRMMIGKDRDCFYFGFLLKKISCAKERNETRVSRGHRGSLRSCCSIEMCLKAMIVTVLGGKLKFPTAEQTMDTQVDWSPRPKAECGGNVEGRARQINHPASNGTPVDFLSGEAGGLRMMDWFWIRSFSPSVACPPPTS